MPGFEFSERIDRPREEVFAFFVDFGRASEWAPEITRVEMLTDGPPRVGARYRELRWTTKGESRIDMEVTAFDPPGRYSAAFDEGGYRATFNYRFTPDGDGTRVEMSCIVRAEGFRTLLAPIITWLLRRQDKRKLRNLKRAVEAA